MKRRDTSPYRALDEERETRTEKDAGCCFSVARVRDKSRAERNVKRVRDPACVCVCVYVCEHRVVVVVAANFIVFYAFLLQHPLIAWHNVIASTLSSDCATLRRRTNAAGKACEYIYVNLRNSRVSRFSRSRYGSRLSLLPPSLPFPIATHTLAHSLTLNLVFFRLRDIACHV